MKKVKMMTAAVLALSLALSTGQAQTEVYFDTDGTLLGLNAGSAVWAVDRALWNPSASGSTQPGTVLWNAGDVAVFQGTGNSTVTLQGNFVLGGLRQQGSSASTIFDGAGRLELQGGSNALRVDDGTTLSLGSGVELALEEVNPTTVLEWNTTTNSTTQIDGVVSGDLGNVTTLEGGWRIGGGGNTIFTNANSYSGLLRISGQVEMRHANVFREASKILLETGSKLKWGTGITTDLSSQFSIVNGAQTTFDIGAQNVTFNTALTGTNVTYLKQGTGTLTVAANSSFTGKWIAEAGVLKSAANADQKSNAFGAGGNTIEIKSGATLDLNLGHAFNYNATSKQYLARVEGKGVADSSGTTYGGFHGAITNSGGLSSTASPFSEIILTGDTTFSGKMGNTGARWGFNRINANGHTLTIVNGNGLSWAVGSGAATMVHDIVIEQGRLWADGTNFGNENYSVIVNAHQFGTGKAIGEFGGWNGGKAINKKVVLNGGRVVVEGNSGSVTVNQVTYVNYGVGANLNNFMSFDLNREVTLLSGNTALQENEFISNIAVKDIKVAGKMTGHGGFYFNASQTSLTHTPIASGTPDIANLTVMNRYATMFITNSNNDFTGTVGIGQGLLRMSDGTNSGKLGAGQSRLEFRNSAQTAIFDLFGTNQSVAALAGSGANHFIQNNRGNSTSKLTVGAENGSGSFAGVIRDYGTLLSHNLSIANEGSSQAVLGLEKIGTGKQILTGANTFTGDTLIRAGHLQIGADSLASSAAQLGNTAITVMSGATLSGNGQIGGGAKQILIHAGGHLRVGVDGSTVAQTLKVHSALTSFGDLHFDLFQYSPGSGLEGNSDFLSITQNVTVQLGGNLVLHDASGSDSRAWTVGTWFRLVDWGTTEEANRNITDWNLSVVPTLAEGLEWKTDQLGSLGRIYIGVVPEPSHISLSFLGLGLLINRRRRR